MRGNYAGPIKHLVGRPALLQPHGGSDRLLAQFDDTSLTGDGSAVATQVLDFEPHARFPTLMDVPYPPANALGFGWHSFPRDHFKICDAGVGEEIEL